MKAIVLTILLIVSYVAASPTFLAGEDEELLIRDERAAPQNKGNRKAQKQAAKAEFEQNEPAQHRPGDLVCPAGKKAEITKDENDNLLSMKCEPCPEGTYLYKKGRYTNCVPCKDGKSSPKERDMCTEKCETGMGWSSKKKSCSPCKAGTFSDEAGFECKTCPKYHISKKGADACLMECPKGYEPTDDGKSCHACEFGFFNPSSGKKGENKECVSCCGKKESCGKWTLSTGAIEKNQCFSTPDDEAEKCYIYLVDALKMVAQHMRANRQEDQKSGDKNRPQGDRNAESDDKDAKPAGRDDTTEDEDAEADDGDAKSEDEHKAEVKGEKKGKKILEALCKSNIDMDEFKGMYDTCKNKIINIDDGDKRLIPSMKKDDENSLSFDGLFEPDEPLSCDADDQLEGSGDNEGQEQEGGGPHGSGAGGGQAGTGAGGGQAGTGRPDDGAGTGRPGGGAGTGRPGGGAGTGADDGAGTGRPGGGAGTGRPGGGAGTGADGGGAGTGAAGGAQAGAGGTGGGQGGSGGTGGGQGGAGGTGGGQGGSGGTGGGQGGGQGQN